MTNLEKLRETFPKTIFIFRKNGNDETAAIMCSAEWLQEDYDQMYKDSAPCEDAVSRSEVLRIAGAPTLSVNAVTEMIKALPPVTPERPTNTPTNTPTVGASSSWIPVSEKLPGPLGWDVRYLVSLAWGGVGVMEYKSTGFHNYGAFNPVPIESITAWMPLPEPYKEGESKC